MMTLQRAACQVSQQQQLQHKDTNYNMPRLGTILLTGYRGTDAVWQWLHALIITIGD
jgi:hypothetical protein